MFFDTHCHLNFSRFEKNLPEVIDNARKAGINNIIVPGTDIVSSLKAVEIAGKNEGIYAAVGIHPHHIYEIQNSKLKIQNFNLKLKIEEGVSEIEKLMFYPEVVAIGEVGLDYHVYQKTKYEAYKINKEFIELQKTIFIEQLKLANKYNKSVIIHNREAKKDLLDILTANRNLLTTSSAVFHCCEPDFAEASSGKPESLLNFAIKHKIYIGVDGDVTYSKEKQEFIKKVPLEMLVLETDSPFLLPEPLRSQKLFPNEPKNIPVIAGCIAKLKNIPVFQIIQITTGNANKLFKLI